MARFPGLFDEVLPIFAASFRWGYGCNGAAKAILLGNPTRSNPPPSCRKAVAVALNVEAPKAETPEAIKRPKKGPQVRCRRDTPPMTVRRLEGAPDRRFQAPWAALAAVGEKAMTTSVPYLTAATAHAFLMMPSTPALL